MNFTAFYDERFDQKNGFEPLKGLEKKVKEAVGFFGEKLKGVIGEGFKQFNGSNKSSFFGLFGTNVSSNKTDNSTFETLKTPRFKESGVIQNIDTSRLNKTPYKIENKDFVLNNTTAFYNSDGLYIESFKKNTKIYSSTTGDIFSINNEAYLFIDGHNSTFDRGFTLESGYIRAPWLDLQINSIFDRDLSKSSKEIKKATQKRTNLFSGYMGPNGEEIPEYILKAVTINYFGKVIKPKIESDIEKTDLEISETREVLKKEVFEKKLDFKNSDLITKQKEKLSRKHKLSAISLAIEEAYSGNQDSIMKPEVASIILSIQKKPEWNNIVLQSYQVKERKRRYKFKKQKTC